MNYIYYLYESANSDSRVVFKTLKSKFRSDLKEIKSLIKSEKYNEASKKCEDLLDHIDVVIAQLNNISDSDDEKMKTSVLNVALSTIYTFAGSFAMIIVTNIGINKSYDTKYVITKDDIKYSSMFAAVMSFFPALGSLILEVNSRKNKTSTSYIRLLIQLANNLKIKIHKHAYKIKQLEVRDIERKLDPKNKEKYTYIKKELKNKKNEVNNARNRLINAQNELFI